MCDADGMDGMDGTDGYLLWIYEHSLSTELASLTSLIPTQRLPTELISRTLKPQILVRIID